MQFAIQIEKTGSRARQRGALPSRQAKKVLSEIAALFGSDLESESVGAAFRRILPMQQNGTKRTDARRKQVLDKFCGHLKARANETVEEVRPGDIIAFRDSELKRGLSPNTVNCMLTYLSAVFVQLKLEEKVASNPVDGTRIKGAKKKAAKRKPFTLEEFEKLLKATDEEWRSLILLAGLTGQRRTDCTSLLWEQVDLKKGTISFHRKKNEDVHEVPIHPRLLKELKARESLPKNPVFPTFSKSPDTGRESVSDRFRNEILPKIGIVQKYGGAVGDGRKTAEYAFHSFRHSLSTWLAEAGIPEDQRMLIIGHEDKTINRGYTHAQAQSVAGLLAKLGV